MLLLKLVAIECLLLAGTLAGQGGRSPNPPATRRLGEFRLLERFGVAHPAQPVEFPYAGAPVDPHTTHMIGPAGEDVPYQQLSNGNILIRTALPPSRKASAYTPTEINPAADTLTIDLNLLTGAYPTSGDVVQFEGTNMPGGVMRGVNYFLKQTSTGTYRLSRRKDLSDTVDISSAPNNTVVRKQGWIVDPDGGGKAFYCKGHGYSTGDPILLTSTGLLPSPLSTDHPYFVIRLSGDVFQLADSHRAALTGDALAVTDTGSGLLETTVDWTWTLAAGRPSASQFQPVELTESDKIYTVANGLTGLRVVKTAGNLRPFTLAPIQGVRLADGTWVATGPNSLYETSTPKPPAFITGYSARLIESGPLLVRIEAAYTINRPEYTYGDGYSIVTVDLRSNTIVLTGNPSYWNGSTSVQFHVNGGGLPCGLIEHKLYWPINRTYNPTLNQTTMAISEIRGGPAVPLTCAATGHPSAQETMSLSGPGYFKETLSLYAGHKSVTIEDDTDSQVQYFLNFIVPRSFVPNQARYRGHGATSMTCGYSIRGSAKIPYVPYTDAIVDIPPDSNEDASYACGANSLRVAPIWYLPATGVDTGWYWQLYDSKAPDSAPLIGYYIGRTSRYVTPLFAGPGLYISQSHFSANKSPAAGVTMFVAQRSADGRSVQRTRREWQIYVGTKADLRDPTGTQPIGVERNVLAGINLSHLARYVFEYPDPPDGWPPPFQDRDAYAGMVQQVRRDSSYRNSLAASAPDMRDLISMWTSDTPLGVEPVVSHLEQFALHWLNILVNTNGNFDPWWHYYQPGLVWEPLLTRAMAVLNSEAATPAQRSRVKVVAALAASIFWDNDYVPWDVDSGEGTGNANQGDQFSLYRAQNALTLFTQPLMLQKAAEARTYAMAVYVSYLHPVSGVPLGSTHYHSAAMDPALANFLDLKNAGLDIAQYSRWSGYGRWLLSALTPPEPRFGNPRKVVSLGDGNTEGQAMHGMIATLLRTVDPTLAAELQWAWSSQNTATTRTYSEFTAPSFIVIDPNAPKLLPNLSSADYLGYWSMLRHGFGTLNETVAWFINGGFYGDHRHADSGQVTIYAHSAPLAIDWNANLYYPQVPGGIQHNRVVREADIGRSWNSDNLPLDAVANWGPPTGTSFAGFSRASSAQTTFLAADGATWTRNVQLISPDAHFPVVFVRDRFDGANTAVPKVLTWNLMAQGPVDTPAGTYNPILRLNTSASGQPNVWPSNGPDYPLQPGLQKFHFNGQSWPAHATMGIDWDLYLVPDQEQRFYIGSWGHNMHNNREMSEYLGTNGTSFKESQYILRVRGKGSFGTLILPYGKGEARPPSVIQDDCGLHFVNGAKEFCIGSTSYWYRDSVARILTTFDAPAAEFEGISIAGGPTEVILDDKTVTIQASGTGGTRVVNLPGSWEPPPGVTKTGSAFSFDYAGGARATFTLVK